MSDCAIGPWSFVCVESCSNKCCESFYYHLLNFASIELYYSATCSIFLDILATGLEFWTRHELLIVIDSVPWVEKSLKFRGTPRLNL